MLRRALPALCGLLLGAATPSWAGSLGVGPTSIELTRARPVAVLNVRNTGSSTSIVQLETMAWSQADGSDRYTATDELVATPEVFELEPGATREVRIGLRTVAAGGGEQSYRVYVREVQPKAGPEPQQLNFAVRIGVPVFASSTPRPQAGRLSWRLLPSEGGCPRLALRNESTHRERITRLELHAADAPVWDSNAPVYVLAGATRVVDMPGCDTGRTARELQVTGELRKVVLPAAQ